MDVDFAFATAFRCWVSFEIALASFPCRVRIEKHKQQNTKCKKMVTPACFGMLVLPKKNTKCHFYFPNRDCVEVNP